MRISKVAGTTQTVLGLVDPDDLGISLPHEHLIMDHVSANFVEPEDSISTELYMASGTRPQADGT